MGPVQSTVDFADAASVRQLIRTKEPLVCLTFPDKTSLYSHKSHLSLASGVLSNVLEDTQQSDKFFTVPLDDADAAVWQVALGLIHAGHHLDSCKVTLENAQALLLLAHKYEIPSITSMVQDYLAGSASAADSSRLAQHLTPETVMDWLTAASRCGLQQQVKLCIDYVVNKHLPVDINVLIALDKSIANRLLRAKQDKYSNYESLAAASERARMAHGKINAAYAQLNSSLYRHNCPKCSSSWVRNCGASSMHCPSCGKHVTTAAELALDLYAVKNALA